jgi:hypothetical protein
MMIKAKWTTIQSMRINKMLLLAKKTIKLPTSRMTLETSWNKFTTMNLMPRSPRMKHALSNNNQFLQVSSGTTNVNHSLTPRNPSWDA